MRIISITGSLIVCGFYVFPQQQQKKEKNDSQYTIYPRVYHHQLDACACHLDLSVPGEFIDSGGPFKTHEKAAAVN